MHHQTIPPILGKRTVFVCCSACGHHLSSHSRTGQCHFKACRCSQVKPPMAAKVRGVTYIRTASGYAALNRGDATRYPLITGYELTDSGKAVANTAETAYDVPPWHLGDPEIVQ